ncbi:hypothetical protein [Streptomyces sp. NPDC101165]|uniref:hypothetical protein n=1 Tax=Streptomyces sp. NPDC101165 TaxID=3366119 RepID=UPI003816F740
MLFGWAEALREFVSQLAAFYERAAAVRTLGGATGSVTVIGAVSPPGGHRTEPVTAHTERFVRRLWSLDRDLAHIRLSGRLLCGLLVTAPL